MAAMESTTPHGMGDGAPVGPLPDRTGTFIIPDIYPNDLGANPPFEHLPGLKLGGDKEVIGCIVKASEGLGWGYEDWFVQSWQRLGKLAGPQFFRGAYHFLRFSVDGAQQCDYLCDLVERAGGWSPWDMMPWVDVEAGGQGRFWEGHDPDKLNELDPATKARYANLITACVTGFVKRFKERTGLRVAVYGRGIYRDLGMRSCMFGADAASNPAYTPTMPREEQYGIPLGAITDWQLCGDGQVYDPGFPRIIPGWGATDYSVYVNAGAPTTLSSLRERCLARRP